MGLGAAAFWIALAAVLIAGSYFRTRREALKQQALLQLVDKTGQLDEQQVKMMFPAPPPLPPHWFHRPEPMGYVALRVFGTILLAAAAGLAIFFWVLLDFGTAPQREAAVLGFAWASLVACIGVGVFAASRFVPPPRRKDGDREA